MEMKVASQIGLKAQKICITTLVIGIINLKTTNICCFFLFLRPHMAATFGQFPANFRFSGVLRPAVRTSFQLLILLMLYILEDTGCYAGLLLQTICFDFLTKVCPTNNYLWIFFSGGLQITQQFRIFGFPKNGYFIISISSFKQFLVVFCIFIIVSQLCLGVIVVLIGSLHSFQQICLGCFQQLLLRGRRVVRLTNNFVVIFKPGFGQLLVSL